MFHDEEQSKFFLYLESKTSRKVINLAFMYRMHLTIERSIQAVRNLQILFPVESYQQ